MKKYILGLLIVIILSIGGYVVYQNYFKKTEYYVSYYELTEKEIKELKTYGEIKSTFKVKNKTKIDSNAIQGEVNIYIRGNKKEQEEVVNKIKKNKNVKDAFKIVADVSIQ